MEMANAWNVRFELSEGGYTFTRISCKHDQLSRDEVQDWAETQVRAQDRYAAVDDFYPVEDN